MAVKAVSSGWSLDPPHFLDFTNADNLLDKEHPLAGVVLCFTSILPEQRVRDTLLFRHDFAPDL